MSAVEKDGLDAFLFSEGTELVDFKCFRGHREDISEDEMRKAIDGAFVQDELGRSERSESVPDFGVKSVDVREFLARRKKA